MLQWWEEVVWVLVVSLANEQREVVPAVSFAFGLSKTLSLGSQVQWDG